MNAYSYTPKVTEGWIADLIRDAQNAEVFVTGIESNAHGRGESINWDLIGRDESRGLITVQVRRCRFRRGRYNRVQKDYYLMGRIESGAMFAHPISSPCLSKIGRAGGAASIDYTLAQIWECDVRDLGDIIRQGDVALVPVRALPDSAEKLPDGVPVTIRESHTLTGDVWCAGSVYYTRRGARMVHAKGEHAPIRGRDGYYRVQPGIRASVYGFSRPTAD